MKAIQKTLETHTKSKNVRPATVKELLRLHYSGQFPNIVFSDEKNFFIELLINTQHNCVYLTESSSENSNLQRVSRRNFLSQVMVESMRFIIEKMFKKLL